MCVFCVWASGESDRLVACGEVNVKPSNQSVDEVIATAVESEWVGESEISGCAGVEIEGYDGGRIGHNGLDLDGVDEGLGECGLLER